MDPRNTSRPESMSPRGACDLFRDRLHAYVECELDDATSRFVSSHLRSCPDCRRVKLALESERLELIESMLSPPKLHARFTSKVRRAVEARLESRRRRWLPLRRFVAGLAAGVVFGALGVSVAFLMIGRPDADVVARAPLPGAQSAESSNLTDPEPPPAAAPGGQSEPTLGDATTIVHHSDALVSTHRPDTTADEVGGSESEDDAPVAWVEELPTSINSVGDVGRFDPCNEDVNGDGRVGPTDLALAWYTVLATAPAPITSEDCNDDCLY